MSTRYNDGSHYENHQRAAELHDLAAHAHRTAAEHHQQDRLTGPEQSRQSLEHSQRAYLFTQQVHQKGANQHGVVAFDHADIATLAHQLWRERGCPEGSPEEDWFHAAEQLRSHK